MPLYKVVELRSIFLNPTTNSVEEPTKPPLPSPQLLNRFWMLDGSLNEKVEETYKLQIE